MRRVDSRRAETMIQHQSVTIGPQALPGELSLPGVAVGLVLFAHGSGSSFRSARNRAVARALQQRRIATLLFDLLTPLEPAGVISYIDGGARGNPGPAGFGVRIERPDGTLIAEFHESIGVATNNVAEYRGLLAALEWGRAQGVRHMHVRSDSLLLVQQMLGNYKVKNAGLQPLHAKARLLAREVGHVTFEHVRREANTHADRLANAAMDDAPGT